MSRLESSLNVPTGRGTTGTKPVSSSQFVSDGVKGVEVGRDDVSAPS